MFKNENESGQSILVIALSIMAILALVALVVDVGNAYAHRRMVQNAVDAAALAGARVLVFRETTDYPVLHSDVGGEILRYAKLNGLEQQDDVRAWFIIPNADPEPVLWYADADVPEGTVGVRVEGDLPFDTYFAHLIGFPSMQVTADAAAYHTWGPCNGDCLFPVIVSNEIFADEPNGEPEIGTEYTLWTQTLVTPGNFGWLYWVDGEGNLRGDPEQGPEVTSLEPNLLDNCRSGGWQAGEWVHGDNGVNFEPVLDELAQYIGNDPPTTVAIPIYDAMEYEGNNSIFRIAGFGEFLLTCAHSSRAHYVGDCGEDASKDNTKYLKGIFVTEHIPEGFEDGCINTGVTGVSIRPPKDVWMPEWTGDD